ncbi:sodium/proton antiporter, CPA1 family [Haloechinothrix alba]|uniref:Sodium/proton antiporter, CPA1 family n=1 Tax=Haloechinothrix alba TaxID=664784 RepID=A0A238W4F3_9PSEU|nr:cation:proton antiporter [Haloechinothrix alba]SNR41485.1 sodium/proton antiporter, CPA1 family [Haloechinothrix alba]
MIDLVVLAGLIVGYALVSGRVQRTSLTAPMVFVTAGLALGPAGLDVIGGPVTESTVRVLAEVTLVLVLFTDAARIELPVLRREYHFPLRLLAIGIPAAVALGAGTALLVFDDFGVWEAALLAAVLVPTDAALGASAVFDERLPVRIRQTVNVESGLNDGIALPVVLLFAAAAGTAGSGAGSAASWVEFAAEQIGLGVLVGLTTGLLGGRLLARVDRAGWINATYRRLAALAVAGLAYGGAELVTGNGFIASFVAGLSFGSVARSQCPQVHEFAEREGELLAIATFTMFGAIIAGPRLADMDWRVVVYAVLSLLVVRVVAACVAMTGTRVTWMTMLFFGWFGPRGLASILFGLLVVEHAGIAVSDEIMVVTSATVLLSVYAHGISAAPLARAFGRRANQYPATAPEHSPVTEHHVRNRPT